MALLVSAVVLAGEVLEPIRPALQQMLKDETGATVALFGLAVAGGAVILMAFAALVADASSGVVRAGPWRASSRPMRAKAHRGRGGGVTHQWMRRLAPASARGGGVARMAACVRSMAAYWHVSVRSNSGEHCARASRSGVVGSGVAKEAQPSQGGEGKT